MNRATVWIGGLLLGGVAVGSLFVATALSRSLKREREDRALMERQLGALNDQLARLEKKMRETSPTPPPAPAAADDSDVAPLRRDVEALRTEVARLQDENRELQAAKEAPPRAPARLDAAALQVRARDGTQKPADRIEALSNLRMLPGGRTPDVVLSMLDLLESGVETPHRADILRHLKGAVDAGQAHRIIVFLKSDAERVVREEAAETLGPLKDDASVRSALEEAARGDTSVEVRREARSALEGERRRRD